MSFYTIKNPQERDKIIEEYLAVKNLIKKRSLDERMGELGRQEELNYVFSPVVKSNEETRSAIKESIQPVEEQMKTLNENILINNNASANRASSSKQDTEDQYFGFVRYKDKLLMGKKEINLSDDKIMVDGVEYDLTAGLWSLINDKNPHGYTEGDWKAYAALVRQTGVIHNPNNLTEKSRPKQTAKYRNFLRLLVDEDLAEATTSTSGKGIVNFLPSDINSLMQTLQVLVGEFAAGNKTTRNQIIAILDDLQRRNKISEGDYTLINTLLLK